MACSKEISPNCKNPTLVQPEVIPEPDKVGLYTNKLPKEAEIPHSMEKDEQSIIKHKLEQLKRSSDQLEPDDRAFFQDKWSYLTKNRRLFDTKEDFDATVASMLKQYQDRAKKIFDSYKNDSKQSLGVESLNNEQAETKLLQCKPQSKWKDTVIDALDDTLVCLERDLNGHLEWALSYSEVLQEMFAHAQNISKGPRSQTHLVDISEDEETQLPPNCKEDRLAMQTKFNQLSPKSMEEIMYMIQDGDSGSKGRGYNVMYFKPETIRLMKKAINRALRSESEAHLREKQQDEKKNQQ